MSRARDFYRISEDEVRLISNDSGPPANYDPQTVHSWIQQANLEAGASQICAQCSTQSRILHDKEKARTLAALMYLFKTRLDAARKEEGVRYERVLFRARSWAPSRRL